MLVVLLYPHTFFRGARTSHVVGVSWVLGLGSCRMLSSLVALTALLGHRRRKAVAITGEEGRGYA